MRSRVELAFPLRAVAALFLERQHLDRPRTRRLTSKSLIAFASDAGGIQLDSINVVDRAHYLTLWSRFGPYDRERLDRLVYGHRELFEYWAHAACLVPTAHFPAWRRAMLEYSTRSRAWGGWLQKNRALLRQVEASIAERGPLGNADFDAQRGHRSGGWWNWKPTTHALDFLWMSGRTLIDSRVNFQKRFDLAERVLPDAVRGEVMSSEEFRRFHLRQSLRAMGAATATDLSRYLTFPRGDNTKRRRALAELLANGEIVEVEIELSSASSARRPRWFALASDLDSLSAAAARRAASRGTTLLTPFDSVLWHRERAARLFGFDYRIEVYTPGHRRVHGYYVLPILHDGHFIGRVDAKVHRVDRVLEVKGVFFEPWFIAGERAPAAAWGVLEVEAALLGLSDSLRSLATFLGAESLRLGRVTPAKFRAPLRRGLKALS